MAGIASEIIGMIASELLPLIKGGTGDQASLADRLPICHLNKHWRHSTLGYSKLWTDISFSCLESLKVLIQRSGSRTLSIKGSLATDKRTEVPEDVEKLDLIMANAHRLRSLRLTSVSEEVLDRLESANAGQYDGMVLLEELEIRRSSPGLRRTNVLTSHFTSNRLHRLWLEGFHYDDFSGILTSSLSRLTTLSLVNVYWYPATNEVLDLLRQTPLLESLTLAVEMAPPQNVPDRVQLPALTTLNLFTSNDGADSELMLLLDLPVLDYFRLRILPFGPYHPAYKLAAAGTIIQQMHSRTPFRGCTLHNGGIGKFYYSLTPDVTGTGHASQRAGLQIYFEDFGLGMEYIILNLLETWVSPSTASVTHLTVHDGMAIWDHERDAWMHLFYMMPAITSLEVSGYLSSAFSNGLLYPDDWWGGGYFLWHQLQSVTLRGLWLRLEPWPSETNEDFMERLFAGLYECPQGGCSSAQDYFRRGKCRVGRTRRSRRLRQKAHAEGRPWAMEACILKWRT